MSVGYDSGRGGGVPALRNEFREPLRAQRDPLVNESGRVRSNREERRNIRKQTKLGRFVRTYGWRAYALPILAVWTAARSRCRLSVVVRNAWRTPDTRFST